MMYFCVRQSATCSQLTYKSKTSTAEDGVEAEDEFIAKLVTRTGLVTENRKAKAGTIFSPASVANCPAFTSFSAQASRNIDFGLFHEVSCVNADIGYGSLLKEDVRGS